MDLKLFSNLNDSTTVFPFLGPQYVMLRLLAIKQCLAVAGEEVVLLLQLFCLASLSGQLGNTGAAPVPGVILMGTALS